MASNNEILKEIKELRAERRATLSRLALAATAPAVTASCDEATPTLTDPEIEAAVSKWMEENPHVKRAKFDVEGNQISFRDIENVEREGVTA